MGFACLAFVVLEIIWKGTKRLKILLFNIYILRSSSCAYFNLSLPERINSLR